MSSDEAYYGKDKQLKDRKGKRKSYNLNRHSRDIFEQKLDFKFSNFQAFQVEKGWNKLFVSIFSPETGQTIAKSGKASVQNGQCHWEDSILSTIWISDDSLEDNEGCLLKLVVAMGSARFGTLGEAAINLSNYIKTEPSTVSLPLEHCCHGTILQVKIQCLTPRRKYREKHRKDANSSVEEMSVGYDDIDNISDVSDNTYSRTSESSHCDQLDNTHHRGELSCKRVCPLATCSDHDFDTLESSFSFWIEKVPQQTNDSRLKNNMNDRKDSTHSKNGPYPHYDTSRSIYSSSTSTTSSLGTLLQDKMEDFGKVLHASGSTLTRSVLSSKDLLNAAQVTIELLHGEAKMWKENARKLMIDVERLQKDLCKKSKKKKDLEMELSVSRKESDGLKEEIERLTTMVKQNDNKNIKFQIEEMDNIIKELKDEIKYQKGLNDDLKLKLKRTHESNIDLVSILQKLEKTIENQKTEIADLSMTSSRITDAENNSRVLEDSEEEDFSLSKDDLPEKIRKEFCHSDAIRCLHEGIELQEFWSLELEHQRMQEKQTNMEGTIQFLEKTLDEKDQEMQTARRFMAQTIEENEAKWRNRLFEKGTQIINFEKKLSDSFHAFGDEILALTQRVQDLEVELCEKHEECRKDLIMSDSFSSNFPLFDSDTAINITEVFLELYKQLQLLVENLKDQDSLLCQMAFTKNENCYNKSEFSTDAGKVDLKELTEAILCTIILLKKLLETKATAFEYESKPHDEVVRKRIRDDNESKDGVRDCSLKENLFCISSQDLRTLYGEWVSEFKFLTKNQQDESAETNGLNSDNMLGQEKGCPGYSNPESQVAYLQSKTASNCSTDYLNDMKFLDWTKDSQTLVDKDEVRNLSELENSDDEQDALFGLEAENVQLSERIFGLEAEMRHLNEEKESTRLALENSDTVVINLQAGISRLETKNEAQKVDLKRMEESMQKKWIEAQGECSFLKVANLKLQATNEKLIEESKTLQTTNGELIMQNLELHIQCTILESKLGESQIAFSDTLKLVENLEHKFTSMLEEIALKEKTINEDLDVLLQEMKKQFERFIMEETFLTQMCLEKTAEVSNLQKEVEHLKDQMSSISDGHKRIASNIVLDVCDLYADKTMLEAAVQEELEKVKLYETKLDNLRAEYEVKVQNYEQELAATRENQETLMVNHEKVVVLLESVKSDEEKLKDIVRGLEVELKASELERVQGVEEISKLEVQLQKTVMLQDEVLALKKSLNEAEFEYIRLEASYQMLSLEYEELKAEKTSYVRKVSTIEKVTSELEDCKRSKFELEEKILRLEWDLTTKEASSRNNAQLRYELAQARRANIELHRKKDSLHEGNEEYQKKVKALEEKLQQKIDAKQDQHNAKDSSNSTTAQDDLKLLQKVDNCISINSIERPSLLPHPSNGIHRMFQTDQYPKLVDLKDYDSEDFLVMESEFLSKINFLEK